MSHTLEIFKINLTFVGVLMLLLGSFDISISLESAKNHWNRGLHIWRSPCSSTHHSPPESCPKLQQDQWWQKRCVQEKKHMHISTINLLHIVAMHTKMCLTTSKLIAFKYAEKYRAFYYFQGRHKHMGHLGHAPT